MAEPAPTPAPDRHRHVLSTVEFDVLWEQLGLGATPVVLQLASPGRTHTERRDVQNSTWRHLRTRGLAGHDGPAPEIARLLHLIAHPSEQLELRAWWDGSVRAIVAGRAGVGALAEREGDTVTVSAHGSLPSALVEILPPAGRGPGRACTVPTATLTGVAVADLRLALVDDGVPATEAALLARMLADTDRRGQVVALAADRAGVLRRAGGVLGVLYGPRGRYLLTRSTGTDGAEWTTVAPTDERQLRHRIAELLSAAAAAAAES